MTSNAVPAYLAEIAAQSTALADAAEGNLTAQVPGCPGWTVADIVAHVFEVHWFWGTIADGLLAEPPAESECPKRPADDELVARFRAGATWLVDVLQKADPAASAWTWAPTQQDVAFIIRHQVQEAAVHRYDTEAAAGRTVAFAPGVATDAIEEFLTFSVSSVVDHPDVPRPDLDGVLVLAATDADLSWTVSADSAPGTVRFARGATDGAEATVTGMASDLLLWLYRRVQLDASGPDPVVAAQVADRFRGLTFTD